jgi:GTP cyclohydrolase II
MVMELQSDLTDVIDRAALRRVDRVISDLRRGEPVMVTAADGRAVVARAAELISTQGLAGLGQIAPEPVELAITGRRAAVLGLDIDPESTVLLKAADGWSADRIRDLVDPTRPVAAPRLSRLKAGPVDPEASPEGAAVALTKLGRLLPAAVFVRVPADRDPAALAKRHDLMWVSAADVVDHRRHAVRTLARIADASVPLEDCEQTRIVAFRPSDGGPEHLAIVIGEVEPNKAVLVRLHSECFTGDLLGSLRCDCGPQLRGAVQEIAARGGGIILYLSQEGRGIGLINKLRAYRLQDGGLDTLAANEALGFEADERLYLPAAEMLSALGVGQVRLMTNNPDKLRQLARCGVEVVERVPHVFPSNDHNAAYLRAKAERAGHMF